MSAGVVGAYGPMLSPGFVEISHNLGITVQILSEATAWLILCLGLVLFIASPIAKILGRRPVFLGAIIIMFATSVWGAAVREYNSFLASRIVAGLGMAPYEVLVQCTIGDMYFVHQRATRIAVWNLFLLTGISGGALIAGVIIDRDGYQWSFGVCAIFFGILMFAVFFFVPETAYKRPRPAALKPPSTATSANEDASKQGGAEENVQDVSQTATSSDDAATAEKKDIEGSVPAPAAVEKKHTYWQELRVFTGRYSYAPVWKIMLRPVVLLFYPAVMWGFLIYGTTITWIVVFSVVNARTFGGPPYNMTVSEIGLISLSPFILTILAEVIAGPLNDWICITLTKKNKGVYEPEFRLPSMIIALIFGICGFYGFGLTVHYQTHWSGPVLCFGFANVSLVFCATCVFGYVVDSYRSLNEEAFVAINARNILTFGLTYFVNNWLDSQGYLVVFCILGSLFVGVCLLTIPLW